MGGNQMGPFQGRLVKFRDKADNRIMFVLSAETRLRMWQVEPSSDKTIEYASIDDVDVLHSSSVNIGDALSLLTTRGLKLRTDCIGLSFKAGETKFLEFQFRPLMAYLGGKRRRILIADEPGLGKTISSSYIMVEEIARSPMNRILILCPSRLRMKWRRELYRRFGLNFQILSGRALLRNMNEHRLRCIVSIDSMAGRISSLVSELTDSPRLDFLLIDEAHHLIGRGGTTQRRQFGMMMSSLSDRVVALTATPLQLEIGDLKRVIDLVDPSRDWDDITFAKVMEFHAGIVEISRNLSKRDWTLTDGERLFTDLKFLWGHSEHHGSDSALEALIREYEGKDFSDESLRLGLRRSLRNLGPLSGTLTRTVRTEVGLAKRRITIELAINLSDEQRPTYFDGMEAWVSERSIFDEIDEFLSESFSHVHRMQLSSCLPAMMGLLESGMRGFNVWMRDGTAISEEDFGLLDEDERVRWQARRLTQEEIRRCKELARKMDQLPPDTKFVRTIEVLRQLQASGKIRKAIIFTHWVHTVEYFSYRSRSLDDIECYVITSKDQYDVRENIISRFRDYKGFAVLFAADVLSEGLDLEMADCIVNYDFPYNPQVIEQRIGRIDRIGQESEELHIINVLIEGSTDRVIYDTLLNRIGIFNRYIGQMPPTLSHDWTPEELIDSDKVIQELTRLSEIERLQSSEVLYGLDDVLDVETAKLFKKRKQNMSSYRVSILRDFFQAILGNDMVTDYSIKEGSLTVMGMTDREIMEISRYVARAVGDLGVAKMIQRRFVSTMKSNGEIRITTEESCDGLFIPLLDPLMEAALRTVSSLHLPDGMSVEVLLIEVTSTVLGNEGINYLVVEHELVSSENEERMWTWWKHNQTESNLVRHADGISSLIDMIRGVIPKTISEEDVSALIGVYPRDAIDDVHREWASVVRDRLCNTVLNKLRSELSCVEYRKKVLSELITEGGLSHEESMLMEDSIPSLESEIENIHRRIEFLESEGIDDIVEIDEYRVVAIIRG